MARCVKCGRPIVRAKLPDGDIIVLDDSVSSKGPDRYVPEYEDGPVPVAVKVADERPVFANPAHEPICGKPGQQ